MPSGTPRLERNPMSPAARSVNLFGIYLVAVGATLVVIPNVLAGVFGTASRRLTNRGSECSACSSRHSLASTS
jgi:hypothetical protein